MAPGHHICTRAALGTAALACVLTAAVASTAISAPDAGQVVSASIAKYAVPSAHSRLLRIEVILADGCVRSPWLTLRREGRKEVVLRASAYRITEDHGRPLVCAESLTYVCRTVRLAAPLGTRHLRAGDGRTVRTVPRARSGSGPRLAGEPADLAHPRPGECPRIASGPPAV